MATSRSDSNERGQMARTRRRLSKNCGFSSCYAHMVTELTVGNQVATREVSGRISIAQRTAARDMALLMSISHGYLLSRGPGNWSCHHTEKSCDL